MNDAERHGNDDTQSKQRRDAASERRGDTTSEERGDKSHVATENIQPLPSAASTRPRVAASQRLDTSASPLRLFCAVELSPEVRARAAAHIARLRERCPHVRASWERDDKLHITIKFFGDVEPERTAALAQAIQRAADTAAPFRLHIAAAGAFPTFAKPRVLWLGVQDEDGHLTRLYQALEHECAAAGFPRDERTFHPHITLARLRHPAGTRELADQHRELGFPTIELPVGALVLIRSELGPKGSCYTALSHHGLALQNVGPSARNTKRVT